MDHNIRQAGFTLIEVLVMTVLLALAFLVFLGSLNMGRDLQNKAQIKSVQAILLHDLQEQIKSRRYDENDSAPWSTSLGLETESKSFLIFDGNDNIQAYGSNLATSDDFTVEISFKISERVGDWVRLIGKGSSSSRNYGLWVRNDGRALFQCYGSGGASVYPEYYFDVGTWYHFVGVKEENNFKIYVDGTLISSSTGSASGTLNTSNDPITIGYAGFHTYFKGAVKEARFWSLARTQNQIQNHINGLINYNETGLIGYWPLNEGSGTQIDDVSPSDYNGTLNGGIWGIETIAENGLSSFDDIDDFNNFIIEEIEGRTAYGAEVQVDYVNLSSKFRVVTSNPSEYKRVIVSINHSAFSPLSDTLIIGQGL